MTTSITVATVNGEWMNDWFSADNEQAAWRPQFTRDGVVNDTDAAAGRLAGLLRDLDADVVALQEAPSRSAELRLFINTHLSDGGNPRYHFPVFRRSEAHERLIGGVVAGE